MMFFVSLASLALFASIVEAKSSPCPHEGFLGRVIYLPFNSMCVRFEVFKFGKISADKTDPQCTKSEFTPSTTVSKYDYASDSSAFFKPQGANGWTGEVKFRKDKSVTDVEVQGVNILTVNGNTQFQISLAFPSCDLGAPYPCLYKDFFNKMPQVPSPFDQNCYRFEIFEGGFLDVDSDSDCTLPFFTSAATLGTFNSIHGNEIYYDQYGDIGYSGTVRLFEDPVVSSLDDVEMDPPTFNQATREFEVNIRAKECSYFSGWDS